MRMVILILKTVFTKKWKGAIVKTRFLIGCIMKRKERERKERTRKIVEAMFPGIHARSKLPHAPTPPPKTADQLVAEWKPKYPLPLPSPLAKSPSPAPMSLAERKAQAKKDYPSMSDEDIDMALEMGLV